MTSDELKAAIIKKKVDTFDLIRTGFNLEPKLAGFKSHEEMAFYWIKDAARDIEKMTQKWERENP